MIRLKKLDHVLFFFLSSCMIDFESIDIREDLYKVLSGIEYYQS
jgi:hypothetical protein